MEININEKTNIRLVLVFAALPFIAAAILWLGSIYDRALADEARIEANSRVIDRQINLLLEIRDRVIRIEERIKRK